MSQNRLTSCQRVLLNAIFTVLSVEKNTMQQYWKMKLKYIGRRNRKRKVSTIRLVHAKKITIAIIEIVIKILLGFSPTGTTMF